LFSLESEQVTGSFKIRGAFNKLLLLVENNPETRQKGVITASSGNHGLACVSENCEFSVTSCPQVLMNVFILSLI